MKVTLLAATGRAGSTILKELVERGHTVTAVVRDLNKLPADLSDLVTVIQDDLTNSARLSTILADASSDVVISAVGVPYDGDTDLLVEISDKVIQAALQSHTKRLVVVGGCGSLWFSPGVTVVDSGHWPEVLVPIARSHMKLLAALKASTLNWTYVSPPMKIELGERTGKYRLGGDELIIDAQGQSWISFEDYAIALVDELETPKFERARFSVGY